MVNDHGTGAGERSGADPLDAALGTRSREAPLLLRMSPLISTLLVTAMSVAASLLLTLLFDLLASDRFGAPIYWVAAAIPAIVAPAASLPYVRLLGQLDVERRRVRMLSGLLSICAWCRKIRNEDDSWTSLEAYLSDRSKAVISHGMCPTCFADHGGDEPVP